jgi:RNA polymerase sigma-70 factor (ECF subfamily)
MIGLAAILHLNAFSTLCRDDALGDAVARARRGDPSAFEEVVRRHQDRVYNLAYRMLRNHDDAEDLTQEAFLRVFESLPRVRDDRALGAYITRVTGNLCISWLRTRRRRSEQATAPDDLARIPDPRRPEAHEDLRAAVSELAPKYRLAITAFYLEGRSYQEAAHALGISVRALKTRLYRARAMLRRAVAIPDSEAGEEVAT